MHNEWIGERLLKDLFRSLYFLAQDREASVTNFRVQGTNSLIWMPVLVRDGFTDDDVLLRFFNNCRRLTLMILQLTR